MTLRTLLRRATAASLGLALATGLAACGGTDEKGTVKVVLSGYPALPDSVPWIVGAELGIFADEGVRISEYVGGSGGGASLRNLLATDAPLASVATSAAAESFIEGVPLVAVGASSNNLAANLLVASLKSGVRSIEDLQAEPDAGWRLGFTNPGSTTETLVDQAVERWGLDQDAVELVSTGGTGEGVALLAAGDIDVFTVPMSAYLGSEDQFGPVLANGADLAREYAWAMLVTTPDLLEERRDDIAAVLRGLDAAVSYVEANPEEAARLWAAEAQIDETIALETVRSMITAGSFGRGGISDEGWRVAADVLAGQGIDVADLDGFFDPSVLDDIGASYSTDLS